MTTIAQPTAGQLLRERCAGLTIHLPGEPDYETARLPWNLSNDQRPAAVALPRSTQEVARVVRAAGELGLAVAPQGTGHGAGAMGDLAGAVLLRTDELWAVALDPTAGLVTVGAGTWWVDVVEAVAKHGQAVLHGSSPDVGVVGYSLGGGIGWYARLHGLACNAVTAATVVTADGRVVHTDADTEPDLFWAIRGGVGNFGVVTELTLRTFPIATAYAGLLMWDWTRAEEVLPVWRDWAETAPDEVTTSLRLLQMPPIPEIPEPFRGRQMIMIDGAVTGTDEEATAILAPLRALGPELDTFGRVGVETLSRLHMDPEDPAAAETGTALLEELPDEAVDALLTAAGPGSGSALLMVELRQLGGALARPPAGAGARATLDGRFLLFALGLAFTPEMAAASRADADRVVASVRPWSSGRHYLNFADNPIDTATAFTPEVWARLRAIRRAVDPDGRFVASHVITR